MVSNTDVSLCSASQNTQESVKMRENNSAVTVTSTTNVFIAMRKRWEECFTASHTSYICFSLQLLESTENLESHQSREYFTEEDLYLLTSVYEFKKKINKIEYLVLFINRLHIFFSCIYQPLLKQKIPFLVSCLT